MVSRLDFGQKWRKWMIACVSSPSFVVLVNGGSSSFFKSSRGSRQGDHLSSLLFIIVIEALHKLVGKTKEARLVRGIKVGRDGKQIEISHLFFADDPLIFSINQTWI